MNAMGVAGEFFVGRGICASLGEGGVCRRLGVDEPRRFCGMMEFLRMDFEHYQARKKCGVVKKARSRF